MIRVSGSTHRAFIFPAELPVAFAYYSDLGRVLTYLPHILLVRSYTYDRFRVLYSTTELGTYHIRIFCDLRAALDETQRTLRVVPLDDVSPVRSNAGLASSTAQGHYSSLSLFRAMGDETKVEYSLQLQADLPTPTGLRLMPSGMVNAIAHSITRRRIREIADGFIERSIDAFPHWLEEMENSGHQFE